jgi:hypothetical protein
MAPKITAQDEYSDPTKIAAQDAIKVAQEIRNRAEQEFEFLPANS